AEALERGRDPARGGLTVRVADALGAIPVGKRGSIELPADADDELIARVLADLTRRDWGVSASRRGDRLRVWRGDRFRRRLWRVLAELRMPLPNKRQAWVHTVGRVYPGELRAHPGLLEEA